MPRTPDPVPAALDLREWALGVLSSPAAPSAPPPAPAASWRLFLRVERCALALAGRGAGGDDAAAEALRTHALDESRKVLAARGQLRRLGAAARERGLRLVVLKGAAPLLYGGVQVSMLDVDVLGGAADARALAEALDASGYQPHGRAASHRLAVRAQEDGMAVEVHTTVPGLGRGALDRAVDVPRSPLRALHPADHLLHLLIHAAVHHEDRRGRIRDLLLTADAVLRCTPDDLGEVRAAISRERQAGPIAAQLRMARAIAEGTGAADDPFQLTAAGSYLMTDRFPRWGLRGRVLDLGWAAGAAAVAARSGTPSGMGAHTLDLPSAFGPLAWLRGRAPAAERAARVLFRRGQEWALLPVGLAIARQAERAVKERRAAGP